MSKKQIAAASLVAIIMFAIPATAAAQTQKAGKPGSVAETLDNARKAYGPEEPKPQCPEQTGDEIVVCAVVVDPDQYRLRSKKDAEDDYARRTMFAGDPQAPDVSGPGIFKGKATVSSMCIPGLQKCPPPPAIEVDFSALPEAPPGSDADRIGRGLSPRGNDLGDAPENASIDAPLAPSVTATATATATADESGTEENSPPPVTPTPDG